MTKCNSIVSNVSLKGVELQRAEFQTAVTDARLNY